MLIAPSILTSNFLELKKELDSISNSDLIHVDIMDGHFVPNISFGPYISKLIASSTNLGLDFHLMVSDPVKWIDLFNFENTNNITIHFEANDILETIEKIKKNNIKVGLSIKPDTNVKEIIHLLDKIDLVLVMSVEPGFGGQKFIEKSIDKVKELNRIREYKKYNYIIEVDGGVNNLNIVELKKANCDMVVVGSYLFNLYNRKEEIEKLKKV